MKKCNHKWKPVAHVAPGTIVTIEHQVPRAEGVLEQGYVIVRCVKCQKEGQVIAREL